MAKLNLAGDDIAATRAAFDGMRKRLGLVPNRSHVTASSPAGLQGRLACRVRSAAACRRRHCFRRMA